MSQPRSQNQSIDVTAKEILEHLYLVPWLRKFAPFVTMPSAPPFPPLALWLFLDFHVIYFPSGHTYMFFKIRQKWIGLTLTVRFFLHEPQVTFAILQHTATRCNTLDRTDMVSICDAGLYSKINGLSFFLIRNMTHLSYVTAMISRLLKNIGLFCRI